MDTGFKKNTIIETSTDLSKYGKDFQVKLLSLLIKDRPFALSILPIIKDAYFTDIYLRNIFSCINSYVTRYNSTPSFDNVKILLQDSGEKTIAYEKLLKTIEDIGLEDRNFVIDNTRNFCFTKYALLEQEKVIECLKRGEFENAKKISIESFKFSGDETAKIYDLHENYSIVFEEEKMRAPVPCPLQTFNNKSKGGPGAGDLVLVVAQSNFGKTAYITAVARHANFIGKNVVYFSYEMGGGAIFSRYLAGLLDVKQEELKFNKKELDGRMKEKGLGLLRVIEDKSSNANIPCIKSHIEYLKSTGFFTDLIIIDGLNQMKLVKGQWSVDNNDKYEQLAEGLKDFFKEMDCPGYATWQGNRSSWAEDLGSVNGIGKAIEVFQKADMLIFFTQPPEMKTRQECIAYMLKNRHGDKEIAILVHYDPNKGIFIEKEELNPLVFLSTKAKQKVASTVNTVREKLSTGLYDKKN